MRVLLLFIVVCVAVVSASKLRGQAASETETKAARLSRNIQDKENGDRCTGLGCTDSRGPEPKCGPPVVDDRILLRKNHKLDGSPVYADEQEWTKRQIPGPADSCAPDGADATISFTDRMGRTIYRRRNAPAAVIARDKKATGQIGGPLPNSPVASVAGAIPEAAVAAPAVMAAPRVVAEAPVAAPEAAPTPKKEEKKPAAPIPAVAPLPLPKKEEKKAAPAPTPAPVAEVSAAANTTIEATKPVIANATKAEHTRRHAARKAEMSTRTKKGKKTNKRHVAEKAEEENTTPTVEVIDDHVQDGSSEKEIDVWSTKDDRESASYQTYLSNNNTITPADRNAHGYPARLQRGIKSGRQVAKSPSARAVIMQQQDFHDEIVNYGPVEHERGPLPPEQTDMWFASSKLSPEQHSTVLPHEQRWNRAPHNHNDNLYVPATHHRSTSATPAPNPPNEQYSLEQAKVLDGPNGRGMAINETQTTVH